MATKKNNCKKRYPRISLGQKMTSVFVFFVIVPFVCVSFLSAFFFQKSVHSWFKDRIQVAMNGAEYIAERYMQDNLNRMHNVSSKVMEQYKTFSQKPLSDAIDRPPLFDQHLETIHQTHQCASVVFSSDTPLSNSHIMIDPLFATHEWNKKLPVRIALQTIETAKKTNSTVLLSHQDHHLCILHYLGNHRFLMTGQVLDPVIGDNVFYVNSAIHSYMDDLKQESRWFWSSISVFLVSCFVLMLLAWWGIARFKFNIIEPVNSLLQGVSMLRAGKISKVKISKKNTSREIDVLVNNFNEMALDIHMNQEHLSLVNQSLQEKNTFMETVVQSVSSGIILLNEKGDILFNNDQAEHLLNSKKIKGMHITSLPLSLNDTLHTARQDPSMIHKKDLFSPATRKTYRIYMRCHSPSKHVIVTMDDIGSLIASQKRSAILDVARRVAHEIRNPLTPIMLAAQRLGHKYGNVVDDTLVFQNCIDSIVRQSEIISNIIKEFLYFVRMPLAHFSECDVSLLIQKNVDLQKSAYPNITFHTHVSPCRASVDALHIERAINNLMKNAIESVLDVEHEKAITVTLTEKNDMIMIAIADTGTGLDTSYVLSDQEPYSSKKPHGMGIGLSIVEQVAKDHGGYFTIQNNTKRPGATAILSIARHH